MQKIAIIAARVVNFLKWPTALLFVCLLPVLLVVTWQSLANSASLDLLHSPFSWGFCGYLLLAFFMNKKNPNNFISTFEHELTHALFALLFLNKIESFTATAKTGGQLRWRGQENWLITIAPYFFPTFTAILLLFLALGKSTWWYLILLGISVAYHVESTYHETHRKQTDLKQVGFIFATLFLIPANLITYLSIFYFFQSGWSGFPLLFNDILATTQSLASLFENLK